MKQFSPPFCGLYCFFLLFRILYILYGLYSVSCSLFSLSLDSSSPLFSVSLLSLWLVLIFQRFVVNLSNRFITLTSQQNDALAVGFYDLTILLLLLIRQEVLLFLFENLVQNQFPLREMSWWRSPPLNPHPPKHLQILLIESSPLHQELIYQKPKQLVVPILSIRRAVQPSLQNQVNQIHPNSSSKCNLQNQIQTILSVYNFR